MSDLPTVDDLLSGGTGGGSTFKFENIGDTFKGEVVDLRTQQQTEFGTDIPAFSKSGKKKMLLVVTVQTDERDPSNPDDDGKRTAYLGGWEWIADTAMGAVVKAVQPHGRKIEIGGTLAVQLTGFGEPSKPGWKPPKQFSAQYRPPVAGVDLGSLLGD